MCGRCGALVRRQRREIGCGRLFPLRCWNGRSLSQIAGIEQGADGIRSSGRSFCGFKWVQNGMPQSPASSSLMIASTFWTPCRTRKTVVSLRRSASQMRNTLIVVRTTCEREKSGSAIIDKLFCKCKDDDLLNRRKSSPEGRLPASRDLGFPCVTFKRLVGTKI